MPDCGKEISVTQNTVSKATQYISQIQTNIEKNTTNFPLSVLISWLKNHTVVTIVF